MKKIGEKLKVDDIIRKLLEGELRINETFVSLILFRKYSTDRNLQPGKEVKLKESDIRGLCLKSGEIFLSQPMLLELKAPIKIVGELLTKKIVKIKLIFF